MNGGIDVGPHTLTSLTCPDVLLPAFAAVLSDQHTHGGDKEALVPRRPCPTTGPPERRPT
jgi:hypothetical protein